MNEIKLYEIEPLQDHCGIVGILSSNETFLFPSGLKALQKLQTRGYDGAGFVAFRESDTVLTLKEQGAIPEAFPKGIVRELCEIPFYQAQLQTRYGTDGKFIPENVQPFIMRHECGDIFAVSHNGQFSRDEIPPKNGESDTAIFTLKLSHTTENTWDERIENTLKEQKGAWSLIIGTKDCMYLSRDLRGIRPLYFAQKNENGNIITVAASETSALTEIGFGLEDTIIEVQPGELIKVERKKEGYSSKQIQINIPKACMFENVYLLDGKGKVLTPRKNSKEVNSSQSVEKFREECGRLLAHEAPVEKEKVDLVVGIPGTAIPGGKGYADELGIPYIQVITDKKTENGEKRTFMHAQIDEILQKVLNHFDINVDELKGKRIVLVDDSIVRGNISIGLIKLLRECGVKEIHFRVLCPPIDKGCFLGVNTRNDNELISRKYLPEYMSGGITYEQFIEKIRCKIGADSLQYISGHGLIKTATENLGSDGFCMGCMLGYEHPIDQYGNTKDN